MDLNDKLRVLDNGCYDAFLEVRKHTYFCSNDDCSFDNIQNYDEALDRLNSYSDSDIRVASLLYQSKRSRFKRLRRKIELNCRRYNSYFGTLTFSDAKLENTSSDTRRQMVRRFLSSLDCIFYANKDFGGQFGREHYHFVLVRPDLIDCDCKSDDYFLLGWNHIGFSNLKLIGSDFTDSFKVAEYCSKCANHALKITSQRSSMIYSRKLPTWLDK